MGSDHKEDIKYIQEWMQKEAYLPKPFGDTLVLRFLHSNYYSLEQTKTCIERFCISRQCMPHVFTNRDPLSPSMKAINSLDATAIYYFDGVGALFYRLGEDVEKYTLNDSFKSILQKLDYCLATDSRMSEFDIIVYDLKNANIKHATKTNPFRFRELIRYFLEANPVRIKKIILLNAPPVVQVFLNIIKPVLPAALFNNIILPPDDKCLSEYVNKTLLPSDFGGEGPSLQESSDNMNEIIINQYREMFLDDNLWKGNVTEIPKTEDNESMSMKGSFRTLNID